MYTKGISVLLVSLILLVAATSVQGKDQGAGSFKNTFVEDEPARSSGGFTVYRNEHWAFEGTDLYYGDVFGSEVPVVGYESDGVAYNFQYGVPYPTGEDGTPKDVEILALTPITMQEEDHGHHGQTRDRGDGDWKTLTKAIYGDNSPENLAKMPYGSCVIVNMKKGKGEVFCAGTVEWPTALSGGEWFSEKITKNVLDRYTA